MTPRSAAGETRNGTPSTYPLTSAMCHHPRNETGRCPWQPNNGRHDEQQPVTLAPTAAPRPAASMLDPVAACNSISLASLGERNEYLVDWDREPWSVLGVLSWTELKVGHDTLEESALRRIALVVSS